MPPTEAPFPSSSQRGKSGVQDGICRQVDALRLRTAADGCVVPTLLDPIAPRGPARVARRRLCAPLPVLIDARGDDALNSDISGSLDGMPRWISTESSFNDDNSSVHSRNKVAKSDYLPPVLNTDRLTPANSLLVWLRWWVELILTRSWNTGSKISGLVVSLSSGTL